MKDLRVIPKFIMFDGEGKYVRKFIKGIINIIAIININWNKFFIEIIGIKKIAIEKNQLI